MVQKTPLEIKWKKEYEVFFNNFPQDVDCIIGSEIVRISELIKEDDNEEEKRKDN